MSDRYQLYYWPFIQGRGELVRLVLEEAAAPYDDVARWPEDRGGGIGAVTAFYRWERQGLPVFAPPVLVHGELVLAQTPAICDYLGARHELAPADPARRAQALQLQLTIADAIDETHDTHHPIASALHYEDQREAAAARAQHFRQDRLPRFLGYFERVLTTSGGDYLLGARLTYPDLSLMQLLMGLAHAFPTAFERASAQAPGLLALRDRVAARPNIRAYLDSPRRLPWNQQGIFRHYPELDD